jgi:hypothetical protein
MNHDQENGKSVTAQSYLELETEELAQEVFEKVKQRMLHVNTWQEFAGEAMAHFNLTDEKGNEVDGPAREGLFFRIDIPGPGSKDGNGFDWVRVEKIEESSEEQAPSLGMRVRPSSNPATADDDIAHFYSDESTSTFHVKREGAIVTTSVVDRNLKPNTEAHGIDEIRNRLVGFTGIIGASKIQWKSLTDGLLSGLE